MKLVIRVDDAGYTKVHNIATFETVDMGVATSVDVMLDTPGTEEALAMLKERPWISTGWHTHFWGMPVLSAEKVPSLMGENGQFRKDIQFAGDVSEKELADEMRAQLYRCINILGKVPDCCGMYTPDTPFGRTLQKICDEFMIPTHFHSVDTKYPEERCIPPEMRKKSKFPSASSANPKWAENKILFTARSIMDAQMTDSLTEINKYDPLSYMLNDRGKILELPNDTTAMLVLHPGYIDYYVLRLGDSTEMALNFMLSRAVDTHMLCSTELQDWIVENNLELVNLHDALYGTSHYQNHLRAINSRLAVKK